MNRGVALCTTKIIELEITMTRFSFYPVVNKLNNLSAMSLTFFNGKIDIKSKSFLMLKKKGKRKVIMIPKAPNSMVLCDKVILNIMYFRLSELLC